MEPFTWSVALGLLLKHGPTAVVWGQKMYENIQAGRGNDPFTAADVAELNRLGAVTPADVYAKLGIAMPPPAP